MKIIECWATLANLMAIIPAVHLIRSTFATNEASRNEETITLPKCAHIDPYLDTKKTYSANFAHLGYQPPTHNSPRIYFAIGEWKVARVSIEAWSKVNANKSGCDPLTIKPIESIENEKERERYKWGEQKFAFDVLASDKIGPRRYLQPMYHEL
ncbi:unnamed protein product [Toxocara canis]|uniref:Uncharacterized protein n=1 Tax=Toxocara canis TaxID=6265 RepID=A0A183VCD6_TOXCA|nr:unnamed protein product [Toxocara canis]